MLKDNCVIEIMNTACDILLLSIIFFADNAFTTTRLVWKTTYLSKPEKIVVAFVALFCGHL